MIRTEHLTMIVVLLFAVSMVWIQGGAVGDQRTQINPVPVSADTAGRGYVQAGLPLSGAGR